MSNPPNQPAPKQDGITFPPFAPKLKLERRPADKSAPAAEENGELASERNAQAASEAESRGAREGTIAPRPATPPARATSEPFYQRPGSVEPFADERSIHASWDQLHRARALLESEQANLRDDRMALRDFDEQLKRREAAVAAREQELLAREQAVAEQEAKLAAATPPAESTSPSEESAVARLTKAPFVIARSVLGPKK